MAQRKIVDGEIDKPMAFELVAANPDAAVDLQQRWVAARGKIMPNTPQQFEAFLKRNKLDDLTIFFDSLGGSIGGGLRLGEALRKANATVAIGQSVEVGTPTGPGKLPRHQLSTSMGHCYSSCAYAFLGGRRRLLHAGASYGVHMFWASDRVEGLYQRSYTAADVEQSQRTSASIAVYLQTMGVDERLLQIAVTTPIKAGIRALSTREAVDLKVANAAFGPPVPAGDGHWGLLLAKNQATLLTAGQWSDKDRREVRYELFASCGPAPEFDTVTYAETLSLPSEAKPLSMRRIVLASGPHDGVLANSGKDGTAIPARFPRRYTTKIDDRLWRSGSLMSDVLNNAARNPGDGLLVSIDEGTGASDPGEKREVRIKSGNLPGLVSKWREACASFEKKPKSR